MDDRSQVRNAGELRSKALLAEEKGKKKRMDWGEEEAVLIAG